MSEQKESSVLFSLKELMNLEEDRIKQEEEAKASAAREAERQRADAERRAREEEEARLRADDERRREEERKAREEAARLEAIRQAEIEKARVEAEQRARLEAMAAQQQHERSLAQLQHDESKKKLRKTLYGVVAGVVVLGAVGGGLAYKNHQDTQQRQAAIEAEARQAKEEKDKLAAQMAEQQKKVDSLLDQLKGAKDEATRLALQKQLDEEKAKAEKIRSSGGGGPRSTSGGGPKPACTCTPGDPLCSCL